jgi:hypothetical protein
MRICSQAISLEAIPHDVFKTYAGCRSSLEGEPK